MIQRNPEEIIRDYDVYKSKVYALRERIYSHQYFLDNEESISKELMIMNLGKKSHLTKSNVFFLPIIINEEHAKNEKIVPLIQNLLNKTFEDSKVLTYRIQDATKFPAMNFLDFICISMNSILSSEMF